MKKLLVIFIVVAIAISGLTAYLQFRRVDFKYELVEPASEDSEEVAQTYALKRYTQISTELDITIIDEYEGKDGLLPVTELMQFSISNCDYLETIRLGKNIKTIDPWAITNNRSLQRIIVDPENPYFKDIDGVLYNKDGTVLLCYPNSKDLKPVYFDGEEKPKMLGEYTVPDGVVEISDNAFYKAKNVRKIVLPSSLVTISDRAFHECDYLAEINIPENVTKIGYDSFSYNNSITTEIILPKSLQELGDYAFFNCQKTPRILYLGTASDFEKVKQGKKWQPVKFGELFKKVPLEFAEEV